MNADRTAILNGEKIEIGFEYNMEIIQAVRDIPGREWNKPAHPGVWSTPNSAWHMAKIIEVLKPFGFYIDPAILKGADKQAEKPKIKFPKGLYDYQRKGIEFIYATGGRCIIADDMGCIDGEEEIIVNRGGAGKRITIAELFSKFNGLEGNWDKSIDTLTRSVESGTGDLRLNKIQGVIFKGTKLVVRLVTVGGKTLNLTGDHEVFTPNGWTRADSLKPGDVIYVNGQLKCLRCGSTDEISSYKYAKYKGYCKNCIYKYLRSDKWEGDETHLDTDGYVLVSKMWNHPNSTKAGSVLQHRLVVEAYLNGLSYDAWIRVIQSSDTDWSEWIVLDDQVDVHHKDENKQNNSLNNLEVLDPTDHARLHANPNTLTEFMKVKEDQVLDVRPLDVREVYDLVMEDPFHSFVVNGIVVHNCGKTAEALTFMNQFCGKTLIITPASVLLKWATKECGMWAPDKKVDVIFTGKQEIDHSADITLMSYGIMVSKYQELQNIPYNCIIFDESHYIKAPKTQRTRMAKALVKAGIPHVLFLSGTPFMNRPSELFTALNMLDPKSYNNFYHYAARYCGWQYLGGMWVRPEKDVVTNASELADRLSHVMLRRTKRDVALELPDLIRSLVPVRIPNLSDYRQAKKDMAAWLKTQDMEVLDPAHVLTRLNVLRQIVGNGKTQAAIELAEDILESNDKVVLFAHHKEVVHDLVMGLKQYGVGVINGDTSIKERQRQIELFSHPTLTAQTQMRVMIITVAGAEGIDLYSASHIIFVEREWTPAREEQAEARLHRIGQKNPVTAYYLVATGTMDEKLAETVDSKRRMFASVIHQDEIVTELLEIFHE